MSHLLSSQMQSALTELAQRLRKPVRLIMGGGGAMLLAHGLSLVTEDIDAVPAKGALPEELDPLVKEVASQLKIAPDWLNPYFSTFTHVLPSDYELRLVRVVSLPNLIVDALSLDDLLIMKCFAGRMKDRVHARALIKKGAHLDFVEKHLERLRSKRIPGSEAALDFLDEVQDAL